MKRQRGGMVIGVIIGVLIGLAAALAVAVYVTKVPVPFVNKGQSRTADQDAAESRKNQNWDPNAPLHGKNPVKPQASGGGPVPGGAPAPGGGSAAGDPIMLPPAVIGNVPPAAPPGAAPGVFAPAGADKARQAQAAASAASAAASMARNAPRPPPPPATAPGTGGDPLGELAAARSTAPAGADPFIYFVQAGAFRSPEDAEAQRARLSLLGVDARVTEREQAGRQVWRVRIGPFDRKETADRNKEKLEAGGVETALVRVQR